jgi:hypothetical protein
VRRQRPCPVRAQASSASPETGERRPQAVVPASCRERRVGRRKGPARAAAGAHRCRPVPGSAPERVGAVRHLRGHCHCCRAMPSDGSRVRRRVSRRRCSKGRSAASVRAPRCLIPRTRSYWKRGPWEPARGSHRRYPRRPVPAPDRPSIRLARSTTHSPEQPHPPRPRGESTGANRSGPSPAGPIRRRPEPPRSVVERALWRPTIGIVDRQSCIPQKPRCPSPHPCCDERRLLRRRRPRGAFSRSRRRDHARASR